MPENPVGLALILGIFDRCGKGVLALSATGGARAPFPRARGRLCGTPRAQALGVFLMCQKGKQYRGRRIATPVCALARNDKGDLVRRGVTRRMAAPSEREPGKAGGAIWGSRPTRRWAVPRVGRDAFIPPFSSPSLADRADWRQPLREDGERGDLIRRCRATFPMRGEGFAAPRGQSPRGVLRLDGNQRDGPLA